MKIQNIPQNSQESPPDSPSVPSSAPQSKAPRKRRARKPSIPQKSKKAKRTAQKTELHVPKRYVKFLIAIFLLPLAWALSQTFFGSLAWATLEKKFWLTEEFCFFGLGALLWLLTFLLLPGTVTIYVFGHELTHALAVWLSGGRVEQFRFSASGGYVVSDRINTWIALAPYFIPVYSLLIMLLYLVISKFFDSKVLYLYFLGALGFTWSFHLSYTLWVIPKGQTDLYYGGTFFSLVVIYIANLILLSSLLIAGTKDITFLIFMDLFIHNLADTFVAITNLTLYLIEQSKQLFVLPPDKG